MSNEQMRKEVREVVDRLVHTVKITGAVLSVECPGADQMLMEELMDALKPLLPKKWNVEAGGCNDSAEDNRARPCKCPTGMTFGEALDAVKKGKRVARKGWNGKNQFVELANCISYKDNAGEIVNARHNAIGNKALAFIGTSGVQMGWLASQADMLAEDWYIV